MYMEPQAPGGLDNDAESPAAGAATGAASQKPKARPRRKKDGPQDDASKRRCVSTACIACRRRKSKCDGNLPACSSCSSVYSTECIYDPNSDHRRKGVYKKDIDKLKTRNSTLEVLIQAILNYPDEEVTPLITQIRTCESLDTVAEAILAKEGAEDEEVNEEIAEEQDDLASQPAFEKQLSGRMGELRVQDGFTRYIGGTSHLLFAGSSEASVSVDEPLGMRQQENPIISWTTVTDEAELVMHLLNMYFTWHYAYFTTISKDLFFRDFMLGKPRGDMDHPVSGRKYCTPLLVNAMLALGCHFTARAEARADPDDTATAGDHFFAECKRLILENDEHEKPAITTVQALALMSVREAGCGRESKGWVYSGMSFRMAGDMGLNLNTTQMTAGGFRTDDVDEDARRITFWGCFLFDKCWSNYLGRLPQLPLSNVTVPKFEVFPDEEASVWAAYTDSGFNQSHAQPSRTRAVALQISKLCEISGDLMQNFYNPIDIDKAKGKQSELKKLEDIHQRLEGWRRELPKEFEPKEGGLPAMLVAHMFFNLLYIHLFRPFLKYSPTNSPLPSNVSPRKLCITAAGTISKLLRLYKRSHGLRQICNIAVYIAQSACTIHLLSLPEKNAKRDITHGLKHLEEIAESWPVARRTLSILSTLSAKWAVELPEEAAQVLERCEEKFGPFTENYSTTSPHKRGSLQSSVSPPPIPPQQVTQAMMPASNSLGYFAGAGSPATTMPPTNAHDFATYQQSALQVAHTPASTASPRRVESRPSIDSVTNGTPASRPSPSDIFGGIDQLLRTSDNGSDWWMRDQHQLAVGFDNWTEAEAAGAWFAAGMPANGLPLTHSTPAATYSTSGQVQAPVHHQTGAPPIGANGIVHHPVHAATPVQTAGYSSAGAQHSPAASAAHGGLASGAQGNGFPLLHYDETQWYS